MFGTSPWQPCNPLFMLVFCQLSPKIDRKHQGPVIWNSTCMCCTMLAHCKNADVAKDCLSLFHYLKPWHLLSQALYYIYILQHAAVHQSWFWPGWAIEFWLVFMKWYCDLTTLTGLADTNITNTPWHYKHLCLLSANLTLHSGNQFNKRVQSENTNCLIIPPWSSAWWRIITMRAEPEQRTLTQRL